MNLQDANELERLSFLWSLVRLVVAAVSLFIGGYPVIWALVPVPPFYGLVGIINLGLTLAWIISGVAAGYLLWRWWSGGQTLFGKKDQLDMIAFLVLAVSGINLGLAGLTGRNIGMNIFFGRLFFGIAGLLYLWAAYQLYTRWQASGRKVFRGHA